jgi:hypothetical protein
VRVKVKNLVKSLLQKLELLRQRLVRWRRPDVPLDVQLEAALAAASVNDNHKVRELLTPYGYPRSLFVSDRRERRFFSFTPDELLEYLRKHPKKCRELFDDSGDKRFGPSPFIEMTPGKHYLVGMSDFPAGESNVQEFETIEEAITDYVLYSLKRGRLPGSQPQAKRKRARKGTASGRG